jgi:hypothetical protein
MLPPTSACRRSPRRQMVIAASATKTTHSNKLNWPTSIQGLITPSAMATDSPNNGTWRRAVISR